MQTDSLLKSILDNYPGINPDAALVMLEKLLIGQNMIKTSLLLSGGVPSGSPAQAGSGNQPDGVKSPAGVDPKMAIQEDYVQCCECGAKMKMLGDAHLAKHGLNKTSYLLKYGYAPKTALVSGELSKKRKESAKDNKLGHQKTEDAPSAVDTPAAESEQLKATPKESGQEKGGKTDFSLA
ncbi:MucR family transcriptional regulator [Solidesulfovibrio magneticus]|uniref:Uncharacterized protein n=1 Tax=Solidesulfovibrio magneticus (strain ATCC 700980 / DSM 13731 / RS-1) TaxID=573370 RepID=C4XTX7_SOLM1|nr:MucR family transcriptional regulator [Solidesulfovibrio magneticus]BAH73642.1 hypothetical protein DMR_01510 [Solidesulfovibrio magneticus RS-1]